MDWFCCPICGKKLIKYDKTSAVCDKVFCKCKKCGKIIEIKLNIDTKS